MVVNLDKILVPYRQQAIALEIVQKVIVDGILIQVLALNEELGIVTEFGHALLLTGAKPGP